MTRTHHFYSGEAPDCTPSKCEELQPELHKICHANNWPPNWKVLVCDPKTGQCCYCYCHG